MKQSNKLVQILVWCAAVFIVLVVVVTVFRKGDVPISSEPLPFTPAPAMAPVDPCIANPNLEGCVKG